MISLNSPHVRGPCARVLGSVGGRGWQDSKRVLSFSRSFLSRCLFTLKSLWIRRGSEGQNREAVGAAGVAGAGAVGAGAAEGSGPRGRRRALRGVSGGD